jgi:3-oxoadipate enol-lactonase / 4-carboxymuconolactone decarboxylase
MSFMSANQITLHYLSEGGPAGTPLVFINSLGTNLHLWDALLPHLPAQFRRVRYDKRGHGLSDIPPAPYTLQDHTRDLAALLEQLEIEASILVGISVGGLIAMDYALQYPDRVRALILCDTAPRIGTQESWSERIRSVRQEGLDALAGAILERWFTPTFAAQHPADWQGFTHMLLQTALEGYTGTCAALRDADLRDQVGRIAAPSLVLCGVLDPTTTPGLMLELAEALPDASFQVIDSAAHLPCVEQPQAVAVAIRQFLQMLAAPEERYQEGMRMRRRVLGNPHVERAEAYKTDFDADFQRFITETAWGTVWPRPDLDLKTRHLMTIAMLAALGREHELEPHLRAIQNTGVTQAEVKEALLQVAIYAGIPAANSAYALAKKVYEEMKGELK